MQTPHPKCVGKKHTHIYKIKCYINTTNTLVKWMERSDDMANWYVGYSLTIVTIMGTKILKNNVRYVCDNNTCMNTTYMWHAINTESWKLTNFQDESFSFILRALLICIDYKEIYIYQKTIVSLSLSKNQSSYFSFFGPKMAILLTVRCINCISTKSSSSFGHKQRLSI